MRTRCRRLLTLLPLLMALGFALAACGPEDARERGDGRGSGADLDNRDQSVEMHGEVERDNRIFHRTPDDRAVTE